MKKITLKEIMNMDMENLSNLSSAELKQVAQTLYSSANKRIKNLQSSELGKMSPVLATRKKQVKRTAKQVNKAIDKAVKQAKKQGKRLRVKKASTKNLGFSTKGRTRNQVLRDVNQARNLINNEFSTTKGMKNLTEELSTRLNLDKDLSAKQTKRFWKLYNEIETHEINPNEKKEGRGSLRIQEMIAQMVTSSKYIRNDYIIMQAQSLSDEIHEMKREAYKHFEEEQDSYEQDNEEDEDYLNYDDSDLPF